MNKFKTEAWGENGIVLKHKTVWKLGKLIRSFRQVAISASLGNAELSVCYYLYIFLNFITQLPCEQKHL